VSEEDGAPKSAFEIAMERLRKKDEESGGAEAPLTAAQKAAILDVKRVYEAKLAEQEILHRSTLARAADPETFAALEEGYRAERARLIAERDQKLDGIRKKA
jgi:hypothetical protein